MYGHLFRILTQWCWTEMEHNFAVNHLDVILLRETNEWLITEDFKAKWFSFRLSSAKTTHNIISTLIIFVKLLGQYAVLYDPLCVSVTF